MMQDGPLYNRYLVVKKERHGDPFTEVDRINAAREDGDWLGRDLETALDNLTDIVENVRNDSAFYFVLSNTDPGTKPALRTYVETIRATHPILARDIEFQFGLKEEGDAVNL